jgi:hypothetical protein
MRIAQTAKIVFLLVNNLVAAITPPRIIVPSHRLHEAPNAGFLEVVKPRVPATYDAGYGLAPRQEGDSESCDRRAKCKRKKIRNPADNTKCIRCPPLTKADPTHTICVKDDDVSEEDKRNQYQEKIKEKIKEKFDKFKENMKERLEKKKERLEKKKEVKNKEWENKDKQRQDKLNQKRFRRMAVCSPAVAITFGTAAMLELADGGFSEDMFDSINGDMLEFWPRNEIDDDWLDKALPDDESDLTNADYVKGFLEVGDAASESEKRSIEKRDSHGTFQASLEDAEPSAEKRNIFTAIANGIRILARVIVDVARTLGNQAGAASRATNFFKNGKKPNLKKPGESKLSHAEQKAKVKEISQNKNWTKCLRGEKPEK